MQAKLCVLLLAASPAIAGPKFEPVAIPEHQYVGGWDHFVGGGLAVFDCSGDGLPELFAAGGEAPAGLFRNTSSSEVISFELDTPASIALTGLSGAYPVDVDSDGVTDLVLIGTGKNRLMKGGPDCAFSDFVDLGFISDDRWTTAFSATWENGQTLPTLAFGNYVDRDDPHGPFEACDDNTLYRPKGASYAESETLSPGFCALSVLFSDWSRSGKADLRVSNDRHYYVRGGSEQLWRLDDVPRLLTEEDGWHEYELWGMGIASRDVTGDGLPDVMLSSMGDQRLQVMERAGTPSWIDAPYGWGTTAQRPYTGEDGRPSTGWHTAFGDVQNDGLDDIFIAKGNVEQMPGNAMLDPNSLLIAEGQRNWTEAGDTAGIASTHRGRGAALVDLNKDGLLDLAVVNRRAPVEVWQNVTAGTGAYLTVDLQQSGTNRDAVGAWIELDTGTRVIAREITVGGGHAGGSLVPEHFGLGKSQGVKLRVIWPDGVASDWAYAATNQNIKVVRNGKLLRIRPE